MERNTINIEKKLHYQTIGMGKRFLGILLNSIFFYFVYVLVIIFIGIIAPFLPESFIIKIIQRDLVVIYSISLSVYFLFFALTEYLFGRSFGHMICNARIVDHYGNKPTFKQTIVRTLCRFIPFDGLSFLSEGNGGWHDRISKTYVINNDYTT